MQFLCFTNLPKKPGSYKLSKYILCCLKKSYLKCFWTNWLYLLNLYILLFIFLCDDIISVKYSYFYSFDSIWDLKNLFLKLTYFHFHKKKKEVYLWIYLVLYLYIFNKFMRNNIRRYLNYYLIFLYLLRKDFKLPYMLPFPNESLDHHATSPTIP